MTGQGLRKRWGWKSYGGGAWEGDRQREATSGLIDILLDILWEDMIAIMAE